MKIIKRIAFTILLLAIFVFTSMLIEPYLIQVKAFEEIDNDIPNSFKGTKVVFISDIHHGELFSYNRVVKLVKKINELEPDIIILGGDYASHIEESQRCFEALKDLKANIGIYGVLGNHDNWADKEKTMFFMEKAGIKCLNNSSVWINRDGKKIKIGGLGDYWTDAQDLESLIGDTNHKDYVLLIEHNPDYVETLKTNKVDMVLSGHTHGGQVTLFGIWGVTSSKYGFKYRTGLIKTNYTKVLVSNGIGMVFHPFRLFARPQINLIYLGGKI